MKQIVVILLLGSLFSNLLWSQKKGAVPSSSQKIASGVTRAVIVGISEYKDPLITNLRFAHSDAIAFSTFLQSRTIQAKDLQIKLLINEQATKSQLFSALDWLYEESEENDQVIIYFSGHGDVESRLYKEKGFLLASDSYASNYLDSGFDIDHLKLIIETLSIQKKAKVILITDACRSGILAGKDIQGPQRGLGLLRQFENEIKILSCQPDQFSIESTQWSFTPKKRESGGGVFTYHLIKGLMGIADKNKDKKINLLEIENYLEEKVLEESNPHIQIPIADGDKLALLTYVDTLNIDSLNLAPLEPIYGKVIIKSSEFIATENADSVKWIYNTFEQKLKAGHLIYPKGNAAYDYYQKLASLPEAETVARLAKRNLAAEIIEKTQAAIYTYLDIDSTSLFQEKLSNETYNQYPVILEAAVGLLGSEHYMTPTLQARKYFFQAMLLQSKFEITKDSILLAEAISRLEDGLGFQEKTPYILNFLGDIFYKKKKYEVASEFYKRAYLLSPDWIIPKLNLTIVVNKHLKMDMDSDILSDFEDQKLFNFDTVSPNFLMLRPLIKNELIDYLKALNNLSRVLKSYNKLSSSKETIYLDIFREYIATYNEVFDSFYQAREDVSLTINRYWDNVKLVKALKGIHKYILEDIHFDIVQPYTPSLDNKIGNVSIKVAKKRRLKENKNGYPKKLDASILELEKRINFIEEEMKSNNKMNNLRKLFKLIGKQY